MKFHRSTFHHILLFLVITHQESSAFIPTPSCRSVPPITSPDTSPVSSYGRYKHENYKHPLSIRSLAVSDSNNDSNKSDVKQKSNEIVDAIVEEKTAGLAELEEENTTVSYFLLEIYYCLCCLVFSCLGMWIVCLRLLSVVLSKLWVLHLIDL